MPLGRIFGRRWLVWMLMRAPAFRLLWVNNIMYSHIPSQHEPVRKGTLIFDSWPLVSFHYASLLTATARLKARTVLDRSVHNTPSYLYPWGTTETNYGTHT
jgi:hypothetical protein